MLELRSSWYALHKSLSWRQESEPGRHDADDFNRIVAQLDRASEDTRVAAKTSLPQLMAQDGNPRCIRPIVIRQIWSGRGVAARPAAGRIPRRRAAPASASARRSRSASSTPDVHAASVCSVRLSRCQSNQLAGETELRPDCRVDCRRRIRLNGTHRPSPPHRRAGTAAAAAEADRRRRRSPCCRRYREQA